MIVRQYSEIILYICIHEDTHAYHDIHVQDEVISLTQQLYAALLNQDDRAILGEDEQPTHLMVGVELTVDTV